MNELLFKYRRASKGHRADGVLHGLIGMALRVCLECFHSVPFILVFSRRLSRLYRDETFITLSI